MDRVLNEPYLTLLFKAYPLRYPDRLKAGFNISLNAAKLLVGLDHTVDELRKDLNFRTEQGRAMTTLDSPEAACDPRLMEKNCYRSNYDRRDLFAGETACFEMKVIGDGVVVEVAYRSVNVPDDGVFDEEGLKIGVDQQSHLASQ